MGHPNNPINWRKTPWLGSDRYDETYFALEIYETQGGQFAYRIWQGYGKSDTDNEKRNWPASWTQPSPCYRSTADARLRAVQVRLEERGWAVSDLNDEMSGMLIANTNYELEPTE